MKGIIEFLVFAILLIDAGTFMRLKVFNHLSTRALIKVIIVEDLLIVIFAIAYFFRYKV